MRLIFKQRIFSWLDSYDIFDEYGNVVYTVEGKISFGRRLHINDAAGNHIATLKRRVIALLPTFEMYLGEKYVGAIRKELTLLRPAFYIDCNGWQIDGNFFEWDYEIKDDGVTVATLQKKIMNWADTYVLDVGEAYDAVTVLMVALAIDAEKDDRNY